MANQSRFQWISGIGRSTSPGRKADSGLRGCLHRAAVALLLATLALVTTQGCRASSWPQWLDRPPWSPPWMPWRQTCRRIDRRMRWRTRNACRLARRRIRRSLAVQPHCRIRLALSSAVPTLMARPATTPPSPRAEDEAEGDQLPASGGSRHGLTQANRTVLTTRGCRSQFGPKSTRLQLCCHWAVVELEPAPSRSDQRSGLQPEADQTTARANPMISG